MKNLKVTEGKCEVIKIDIADFKQLCIGSSDNTVLAHIYLPEYRIEEHHEGNAEVMADAINTYNTSGLTPSELLQQRNELFEMLKKVREEARALFAHCEDQGYIDSIGDPTDGTKAMLKVLRKSAELINKVK